MKLTALTNAILEITMLIDSGRHDGISLSDVKEQIKKGTVVRFLIDRGADFSAHLEGSAYGNFEKWYGDKLERIREAYAGDERRKWGIEKRGLCLLLAWTNELIQQGDEIEMPRP